MPIIAYTVQLVTHVALLATNNKLNGNIGTFFILFNNSFPSHNRVWTMHYIFWVNLFLVWKPFLSFCWALPKITHHARNKWWTPMKKLILPCWVFLSNLVRNSLCTARKMKVTIKRGFEKVFEWKGWKTKHFCKSSSYRTTSNVATMANPPQCWI